MKLPLALHLLLLMNLQLYHLPPPLSPPISNSSFRLTRCQPVCASCCTGLLYFSRYCKILNVLFFLLFLNVLCEKYLNLLQYSTVADCLSWLPRLTGGFVNELDLGKRSCNGTCP